MMQVDPNTGLSLQHTPVMTARRGSSIYHGSIDKMKRRRRGLVGDQATRT